MVVSVEELKQDGWYVDSLKLKETEFPECSNAKEMITELMNWDMKSFGASIIADRLDKKSGFLSGPLVLQLTSWRNISHPKIPEHNDNDSCCKFLLSDGFASVPGVQLDGKLSINGKTPYGSKVLLLGQIPYECGYLILNGENCRLLGGNVEKLVERWKMSKLGASVVKKVEKDASYTKFRPFSSSKVSSISKAMNKLTVHEEESSSPHDAPIYGKADQLNKGLETEKKRDTNKVNRTESSQRETTGDEMTTTGKYHADNRNKAGQRFSKANDRPSSNRRGNRQDFHRHGGQNTKEIDTLPRNDVGGNSSCDELRPNQYERPVQQVRGGKHRPAQQHSGHNNSRGHRPSDFPTRLQSDHFFAPLTNFTPVIINAPPGYAPMANNFALPSRDNVPTHQSNQLSNDVRRGSRGRRARTFYRGGHP